MFFWNSLAFSMIQRMLVIWSLVPLPFLKPAWTSWSSRFTYCVLKPSSENFEHYFTSMWDEGNCVVVWAFFGIAFVWLWRRKWQSTPVLLPGKSHGWRSLVGYSPWDRKESDTTERLHSLHSLLWHWNENWPFPVLWPLLSFPNLLVYWVLWKQHFHNIIFQVLK